MADGNEPTDPDSAAHALGVANNAGERAGRLHPRDLHDDTSTRAEPDQDAAAEHPGPDDEGRSSRHVRD